LILIFNEKVFEIFDAGLFTNPIELGRCAWRIGNVSLVRKGCAFWPIDIVLSGTFQMGCVVFFLQYRVRGAVAPTSCVRN